MGEAVNIPQVSTSLVTWFGSTRPVITFGRLRARKSTRHDHFFQPQKAQCVDQKLDPLVSAQVTEHENLQKIRIWGV